MLYVGAKAGDRVWASVLLGRPGFLSAAGGPTKLTIDPLYLAYGGAKKDDDDNDMYGMTRVGVQLCMLHTWG